MPLLRKRQSITDLSRNQGLQSNAGSDQELFRQVLRDKLGGKGLIDAMQSVRPYTLNDDKNTPIKPAFQGPIHHVEFFKHTSNFCTLQGYRDGRKLVWYWEDATAPFHHGGKINHYVADEKALRTAKGNVIFVVVPATPYKSPIPPSLINPPPIQNR